MKNINKAVRGLDFFAVPVSLTYKGKKKFSTMVGGICSLVLILGFVAYSAVTMHTMIEDPVYNLNR